VIEQPIGAPLSRDFVRGEQVEGELDRLIAQRDRRRRETEGDRAEEAAFREGERRAAQSVPRRTTTACSPTRSTWLTSITDAS
jgi:hypothetical protein